MILRRIKLMDKKSYPFSILLILCLCFSIFCSSPLQAQSTVTLTVGDGSGAQSSSGNPVEVSLENLDTNVLAVGVDICGAGNSLACTACETTDRTSALSCYPVQENKGCCQVRLYDAKEECQNNNECEGVSEGEGAIFKIFYSVSAEAPIGECWELGLSNIELRDENLDPLESSSVPGEFCVPCTGHGDCDDGLFCNGAETCVGGICQPGENPCPGQVCEEDSDMCFDIRPLTLTVGDGAGYRGSHNNRVDVTLDNPVDKVRAIQMDICDADERLMFKACKGIDRAADFRCETSEEREKGCLRVILLSLDDAAIEKGNGPIVELTYDISADAPEDACKDFNLLDNISVADVSGNPMDVTTEGSQFCFYNCSSYEDCYDGVFCNGRELCTDGICQPPTGIDPCPQDYVCDKRKDQCFSFVFCNTDKDCDDGLYCNGQEICFHARSNVEGKIVPVANCRDGSEPCPPGFCDEDNNACLDCLDDADCNDGLFCNGEESCVNGSCQPGMDPCPGQVCDEESDQCLVPPPPPVVPCTISIQPESADVVSGESVTFTVTPEGECSTANYEWSVESGCGSICDQTGNYKAGLHVDMVNPATDAVRVVDHGNGDIAAEATVTVSFACPLMQIYGEQSKELEVLRSFRDNVLSQTPEGQELTNLYYQWSPMIAGLMSNNREVREDAKELIDGIMPLIVNATEEYPRGEYQTDSANGRFQSDGVLDVKCGDIEPSGGDGEVDINDVMEAIDIVLGIGDHSDCQLKMADVTTGTPPTCHERDGEINIFDVLVILDVALEKEPHCCTTYLACQAECLTVEAYDDANDAASRMKTKGCSAFEIYKVLKDIYLVDTMEAERILHQIGFPEEAYIDFTAQEWVERFAPVLMFDGSHKGLPMSAEVYFESGLLKPVVDENAGTIRWATDWEPACDAARGITPQCGRDECTCGMQNNDFQTLINGDIPTYYKVISDIDTLDEGRLRIAYWWFYGFQPHCNPLCIPLVLGDYCGPDGSHHGDWEHILVTTSPDRSQVNYVTYSFHGDWYTRTDIPSYGERPAVYVGKLGHGIYHSNEISGWMVGTPHHCCEYADHRNPKENTIWDNTYLNLVSLRGTSESWMQADHIGSSYTYNGSEYIITGWNWGPHISYCDGHLKACFLWWCWSWCANWEHTTACSTHPTDDRLDWTIRSCDGEGCGTNNCEGLVYTHDAHYNQGWPWDN